MIPLRMVAPTVNHHHISPQKTETATDVIGTKGPHHLSSHCHPLIVGLRVTRACYQWLPPCHPGLTDQMDPSIPDEGDGTERTELA